LAQTYQAQQPAVQDRMRDAYFQLAFER